VNRIRSVRQDLLQISCKKQAGGHVRDE